MRMYRKFEQWCMVLIDRLLCFFFERLYEKKNYNRICFFIHFIIWDVYYVWIDKRGYRVPLDANGCFVVSFGEGYGL